METSVINIGNSKGIELTKTLIDKYHITDTIELILEKDYIIIKPVSIPRNGWELSFKEMHGSKDDTLLIPDMFDEEIYINE